LSEADIPKLAAELLLHSIEAANLVTFDKTRVASSTLEAEYSLCIEPGALAFQFHFRNLLPFVLGKGNIADTGS
jgi:hypothetical protein